MLASEVVLNLQLHGLAVYFITIRSRSQPPQHRIRHTVQLFVRENEVNVACVDCSLLKQAITHTLCLPAAAMLRN
jgi:hypothetical protein